MKYHYNKHYYLWNNSNVISKRSHALQFNKSIHWDNCMFGKNMEHNFHSCAAYKIYNTNVNP